MSSYRPSNLSAYITIAFGALALAGCQSIDNLAPGYDIKTKELPPWELGEIQQTFKVFSIANAGQGTLREAIQLANASPGADKIVFESDDELYQKPQTIHLESPLPKIKDNLFIDGYIDDMLWKASGVTIDGENKYPIFNIQELTKVKIKHLSLANGKGKLGGAIQSAGELVVEGSTLNGNSAGKKGGAIYSRGPRTIIYNSTFYENSARKGGALANDAGLAVLTNTTFTDNTADLGGAVFNQGALEINNTILANSVTGQDCHSTGKIISQTKNIIESNTGCGTPYSSADPKLGKANYYNGPTRTIALGMRSPAVNYGDNGKAVDEYGKRLKWDQRGNGDPRNAAGVADIGAFETQAQNIIEVDTLENTDYRWCVVYTNDCSLSGALRLAIHAKRFSTITFNTNVFAQPSSLALPQSIPELNEALLIKADPNQQITLRGSQSLVDEIRQHPFITLENVHLQVDSAID